MFMVLARETSGGGVKCGLVPSPRHGFGVMWECTHKVLTALCPYIHDKGSFGGEF